MSESIILSHSATAIISAIAFFATIISFLISNKKIASVVQIASLLGVLAVMTYALLLGAELTEILILLLIFVFINAFSFIPKREIPKIENVQTEIKQGEIESGQTEVKTDKIENFQPENEQIETEQSEEGGNEL